MVVPEIEDSSAQIGSRTTKRPRVVISHLYMGRAGSEANVMWLCQALKGDYDLTVVTTGGWDLDDLNQYYGTSIEPSEVHVRLVPMPPLPHGLFAAALRGNLCQRYARRIASEYDIRISAYSPTDWGLPAIHFIADFSWHDEIRNAHDPPPRSLIYKDTLLRRAYLCLARACGSRSGRDLLRQDLVIANSEWSAAQLRRYYPGASFPVIYHPVRSAFPKVRWDNKENSFVIIGRIAPEKRVEEAIAILAAVRSRGHAVQLHLCGAIGRDPYGRRMARLCAEHADWIVPEGRVSGENKVRILTQCRYGIQTRHAEPFGISVAEMVNAGAIVFAPARGGQAEILNCPELLFTNQDDAVAKIHSVLSQPDRQEQLAGYLAGRVPLFDENQFVRQVRALLHRALAPVSVPAALDPHRAVP